MKIRHFLLNGTLDPKFGGPTFSVPIQCISTKQKGADVSLVVYEGSKPFENNLIENGVTMIHLSNPKNKLDSLFSFKLLEYLKNNANLPDIFHSHGIWLPANLWVALKGINKKIPYVINPRGDTEITRINYNFFKKIKKKIVWFLWGKRICNKAACLIATSEQEKNSLLKLGVKSPIAIIPNGIDLNNFPQNIIHNRGSKKTVLFLSRINPIKGIEYLLEAWSKIDSHLKQDWELHIAGNSDPSNYIDSLKNKVKSLNIQESVEFIGPLTGIEKFQKYQNSDLFILPTLNENFGNVVAEALMCECPVITTTNAPWKMIKEEGCGWWIDLSVENLIVTLEEAMNLSDEKRIEMGKMGRKSIINNFSSEKIAEKTMLLYGWITGLNPKPDFVEIPN